MSTSSVGSTEGASSPAGSETFLDYALEQPVKRLLHIRGLKGDNVVRFVIFNIGDDSASVIRSWLKGALPSELYSAVLSVKVVTHTSGAPRADLIVKKDLGDALRRVVREVFRSETAPSVRQVLRRHLGYWNRRDRFPWYWRIDVYRPWRDREKRVARNDIQPRDANTQIMTWNVNGYHSKSDVIESVLSEHKVAICAIQETLVSKNVRPIRPTGYRVYSSPRVEGFRGQALIVDERLHSYLIPHDEPWLIHVKISHWERLSGVTKSLHVLGIYFPSGGNYRGQRRKKVQVLRDIVDEILSVNPYENVVILGDFNMEGDEIAKRVRDCNGEFFRHRPVGSDRTRFPTRGRPAGLDHLLVSITAFENFRPPRVLRDCGVSDHRPIGMAIRKTAPNLPKPTERYKYDRRMVERHRMGIVSDNRWELLAEAQDDVEQSYDEQLAAESLNPIVDRFNKEVESICLETGIKTRVPDAKRPERMPRIVKLRLKRVKRYAAQLADEVEKGSAEVDRVRENYGRAVKAWKRVNAAWKIDTANKQYLRIAEDFAAFDVKSAWTKVKEKSHLLNAKGEGEPMKPNQPLRDSDNNLVTDPVEVAELLLSHYERLLTDVPSEDWHEERFWRSQRPDIERIHGQDMDDQLNGLIQWPEVLLSIRRMNAGTAPGGDGLHIDVLKGMLAEECMAELKRANPNFVRRDNIQVHLPENELPNEPTTRMGKVVHSILRHAWYLERIPESWEENVVVSLFKKGDPEQPNNYRGVTLISVLEKVLTGVMLERLRKAVERNNLLSKSQAGFRRGEEAIAQVVTLAEIVRRRELDGKATFGVFIDFKKAYDKVPHGLLWYTLRKYGIDGKYLRVLKAMYASTKISVRAGGGQSRAFRLERGLRQGCLLSPLLFDLFIDRMLETVGQRIKDRGASWTGVPVPGRSKDSMGITRMESVYGLLYADDIVAFFNSIREAKAFLRELQKWCEASGMELGLDKCGIMLWSTNEEIRRQFESTTFIVPGLGEVEKVRQYKYLGVVVDENLPRSREPLAEDSSYSNNTEMGHALSLANKGWGALHAIRPVLLDRFCPIHVKVAAIRTFITSRMLYGAEWIGFKQANSDPCQRVLTATAKVAVGLKVSSREVDGKTLLFELGIPSMREAFTAARTRLYAKASRKKDPMRTYLRTLVERPELGRKMTWVSSSRKYIKTVLSVANNATIEEWAQTRVSDSYEHPPAWWEFEGVEANPMNIRSWVLRGRSYETHVRSNKFRMITVDEKRIELAEGVEPTLARSVSGEVFDKYEYDKSDYDEINGANARGGRPWEWRLVRSMRDAVLEEEMKSNKSASWKWYNHWELGATRGFIRSSIRRPDLREGLRWLIAIRTHWFPRVNDRHEALTRTGMNPRFDRDVCPLCRQEVQTGWEWSHLMTECTHHKVQHSRDRHLEKCIRYVRKEIAEAELESRLVQCVKSEVSDKIGVTEVVAIILVGGVVDKWLGCSFTFGFGQTELVPLKRDSHTYVYVVSFLQEVASLYVSAIGLEAYGTFHEARVVRWSTGIPDLE